MVVRFIKCTIAKPLLFDNKLIEFAEDITLIKGKNGSGKSFAAKTLIEAFWIYFPWSEEKRWNTIDDTYLDLNFSLNNDEKSGSYRFRYQASTLSIFDISEWEKQLARLIPSDPEYALKELNAPLLEEFLSSNNLETFISGSYIPSPADIEKEEVINYDIIKNILINDESGFYKKYSDMDRLYSGEKPYSSLFSKIQETKQTLSELNKEIEIIQIKNLYSEKLDREKKNVESDIKKLKAQEEHLKRKKTVLEQTEEDLKRIDLLNQKIKKITEEISVQHDKTTEIKTLKSVIDSGLGHFKFSENLESGKLDKIQTLFREIIDNNEKINLYMDKKRIVRGRLQRLAKIAGIAVLISSAGILLRNPVTVRELTIAFSALLVFALLVFIGGSLYYVFSLNKKELRVLKNKKDEFDAGLKAILEENSFPVENYNLDEIYDILLKYFEDYIEYNDHLDQIDTIRSTMPESAKIKDTHERLKIYKHKTVDLQKKIDKDLLSIEIEHRKGITAGNIPPLITDIDNEAAELQGKINSQTELLARIEKEKLSSIAEDYDSILIKRDDAQKLLDDMLSKLEAASFVTNILSEAVKNREQMQLKKLIDGILSKFNAITENQFKATVDEETVKNFLEGNGRYATLSPPVIHTLHLSTQFSLNEFLSDKKNLMPMIFDDPFLFMDDDRIEKILEQIREIAATRQVIVFTHRITENCREKVIEL
ncbi:MAG: hypothetical protein FWG13_03090 [Leptospirales bacterium]|nr:hypothetical protein [Leptospirales bacterium]